MLDVMYLHFLMIWVSRHYFWHLFLKIAKIVVSASNFAKKLTTHIWQRNIALLLQNDAKSCTAPLRQCALVSSEFCVFTHDLCFNNCILSSIHNSLMITYLKEIPLWFQLWVIPISLQKILWIIFSVRFFSRKLLI